MAIMSCGQCKGMILLLPRKRPSDDFWVRFIPDADTNIRELLGPNTPIGLISSANPKAAPHDRSR
jgi:hypothetical protein